MELLFLVCLSRHCVMVSGMCGNRVKNDRMEVMIITVEVYMLKDDENVDLKKK